MSPPISIDIYSDMVCPWCYLGKRRLEAALRQCPDLVVRLSFKPYELNPDLPPDGVDRAGYMAQKFPDARRVAAIHQQLLEHGQAVGIPFHFEAIRRVPNTRLAHRLVALAGAHATLLIEAVFSAYFERGEDIGQLDVLLAIAGQVGLNAAELREALAAGAADSHVDDDLVEGRRLGIQGVPFFVIAGRWAVSGAQDTAQWVAALREIGSRLQGERPTEL
jgi:predicted DsbA family dithiol-disulfide isomerase